ncbi:helix-turn-helix domain-containing protein [Fulvimonas sp. R45]|uniref:helix-turn-helix domain-containing protein n=1 Tax=Fulvimonas sp. R45 TaxID=3045937 RepID=UPI00265FFAD8|nr:helix-turn-helix domain-containing protein [Fulvimonas sp. R45]MDO1529855.1 helix-turn-helix domain-containing protein [Fulvimonas sp. R45]
MDSLITAAARALATGDPLGALNRVALRDDPPALALRGIALAQLGDFERAKALLRRAARAFGTKEAVARARCVVAEAEVALAARELGWPTHALETAQATLEAHDDRANAAHARYLGIRRLLLLGRIDEAGRALDALDPARGPPPLQAIHALLQAGIALRRVQARTAQAALGRAAEAARRARIPALMAEVEQAARALDAPAARRVAQDTALPLRLHEVEALLGSGALVVDGCRHAVHAGGATIPLATRPVLFALVRMLGEAWPHDAPREALIRQAFRTHYIDETHRARLRVEIGRLRGLLREVAGLRATRHGFVLLPRHAADVVVLARPVEEAHAAVLALLADGEAWSSSALGLALGTSQRSVQRALDALAADGKAQPLGHGRARRWTTPPMPGFATALLLPAPLPGD